MFITGFKVNSVSLSSVFGHVHVDELNNIVSNWGCEDSWYSNFFSNGGGFSTAINN